MAGFTMRGALIEFTDSFPLPLPNIIAFQYNPETMTHTWTPAQSGGTNFPGETPSNPLAVTGPPEEMFSFTLAMDAGDTITDGNPAAATIAAAQGVYPRLAALELLLFPVQIPASNLVGSVSSAIASGSLDDSTTTSVPSAQLPTVLFVWGPGRIAPVRVMDLTITEKLYDCAFLVPTRAEAQLSLKVLTPPELEFVTGPLGALAKASSTYTAALRQTLALANLANTADAVTGMLPV